MSDTLYGYYERELLFVREEARQFAAQYPAAAGRLLLEPNGSIDPHVERLIEAFALLSGRIQKKLDDDFPELTDALLNVLYPHFLAPIPSLAIVQFQLEAANAKPEGIEIARSTRLHTQRIEDCECRFRTCYPTTLWPLRIRHAQVQTLPLTGGLRPPPGAVAALRIQIECVGEPRLADLNLDKLRLFLDGADAVVALLHDLILNHTIAVELHDRDDDASEKVVRLAPRDCLLPVGYQDDEGLLSYPHQSFLGYRLLSELFAFPYKFHFVDVAGWRQAAQSGFGRSAEIVLHLNKTLGGVDQVVDAKNFQLHCCPVVNLFPKVAEPIKLTHTRTSYPVVPDVHHPLGLEVYSIDGVTSVDPRSTCRYQPFYGLRYDSSWNTDPDTGAYWYAQRRPSTVDGDGGTDVHLQFVNAHFDPGLPADSVIVPRTTCTNRDLPVRLQQVGHAIRFQLETPVPIKAVHCLRAPTASRRPPIGRHAYWRLISHLTLNYLSLSDGEEGLAALRDILGVYAFAQDSETSHNSPVTRRLIDGITSLRSRRVIGRFDGAGPASFCRGLEVSLELDPQRYVGTGAFLFASVMERFFGMSVSLNSFAQTVLRFKGSDEIEKKWPPRAGEMQLL